MPAVRPNAVDNAAEIGVPQKGGGGVEELRIDFGPGYRVYYAREASLVVVLLCGGSKGTQGRDLRRAQRYWKEYLDAKTNS